MDFIIDHLARAYEGLEDSLKSYQHRVMPNNKLKMKGLPMRRKRRKRK